MKPNNHVEISVNSLITVGLAIIAFAVGWGILNQKVEAQGEQIKGIPEQMAALTVRVDLNNKAQLERLDSVQKELHQLRIDFKDGLPGRERP